MFVLVQYLFVVFWTLTVYRVVALFLVIRNKTEQRNESVIESCCMKMILVVNELTTVNHNASDHLHVI